MNAPTGREAEEVALFLADAAGIAGRIAIETKARGMRRWTKHGDSPVSEADMAADAYLRERLMRAYPDGGWLSEETADTPDRLDRHRVFVVDPIDGTRAFLAGFPDWCVSVALVEDGRPIAAALVAPVLAAVYRAAAGTGAIRDGVRLSARPDASRPTPLVAGPRRMIDAAARVVGANTSAPRTHSLALRIAGVADGTFDLGLAGPHAHDWDLAAADLLLHEAGGRLAGLDLAAPRYNRASLTHGPLIAAGSGLAGLDLPSLAGALPRT
jgi:myo-inositol-1(or 4)-monophosphatase